MSPSRLLLASFLFATACGSDPAAPAYKPPPTTSPPPRVVPTTAPPPAPLETPSTPLEELRFGLVGRWVGKATFEIDKTRSWSLWLDLYGDGHYAAGCLDDACIAAFREGNDGDWPSKRYSVYDLGSDGAGIGEIYILIGADGKTAPALLREALEQVRLSADKNTLTFDFRGLSSSASVVHYELKRVG